MLRYCSVPDHLGTSANKWPSADIAWTITDSVPGIADAALQTLIGNQLARWAKAANVVFTYTDNARSANILVTSRAIDGPENILAETELPQPGLAQVHLWFDTAENWLDSETPGSGAQISIDLVALHELGHALGLGHRTDGGPAIMDPIYNPAVSDLEPWDIQQAQSRYGPPLAVAVPIPIPIPVPGGIPMPTTPTVPAFPIPAGGFTVSPAMIQAFLGMLVPLLSKSHPMLAQILQWAIASFSVPAAAAVQALALPGTLSKDQVKQVVDTSLDAFDSAMSPNPLIDWCIAEIKHAVDVSGLLDLIFAEAVKLGLAA